MAIDFELTGKMKQARDLAHMFAEQFVRPYALEADELEGPHPRFVEACKQFGLGTGQAGAMVGAGKGKEPAEGGERRAKEQNRLMLLASEELAWGDATAALNMPGPGLGGPPVQFTGTPEQRARFLGVFKPDEYRFGAYALTEPGAGSDAKNLRTTCRKDGDHWVLNGTKIYITNGKKAEWTVVFATLDPAMGRAGHRTFVVEKGTPGFSVPKVEKKMGLKASETAEQVFEECRVPADNLLGGEAHYEQAGKGGFKTAMKTFDATRPLVAVMAVGIARAAFEIARDWVGEHYALAQHTARYHRLAEALAQMEREIHMARLLCWKAAYLLDMERPNAKESSMSKAYAGGMVQRVTAKALEVLGPEGVLQHRLVEKLYRDQKVYDIFEGTGQIQRLVISRRLFERA
ncbi:MAG: acyl-CoA dehydrogenase family protein [Planctomycetes bacterium]|nr:acyl-CoA dehydrogenase family protein [Planctomycetota bacterium]